MTGVAIAIGCLPSFKSIDLRDGGAMLTGDCVDCLLPAGASRSESRSVGGAAVRIGDFELRTRRGAAFSAAVILAASISDPQRTDADPVTALRSA